MPSRSGHWNTIFARTEDSKLGWYEHDPAPTLDLLDAVPGWQKSTIFIPGVGTSTLIDQLSDQGTRLILNDISQTAIEKAQGRLAEHGKDIKWLCQDIAQPLPTDMHKVDIWIDRAVLHFLSGQQDIVGYFDNLRSILKPGGYALFAEFSKSGERKCAGLAVHRYSAAELASRLGESFQLVTQNEHTYINPQGSPRPYIYALFRRL